MNTTPTPGDLSARHVEALNELRIGVEFDAHCDPLGVQKLAALDAAIAALSALPAASEPIGWTSQASLDMVRDPALGTGMMGRLRTDYLCIPLYTTPAPVAASGEADGEPLGLTQEDREALNYLGSSLRDPRAMRAVDKALVLCDFYAGRSQLSFHHQDILARKLLPAAAPAVAKMWLELVEKIAEPLNCRASQHVDANGHVVAAARELLRANEQLHAHGEKMFAVRERLRDALLALADELDNAQASSHLGSLHAAGVVAGCRSAAGRLRALLTTTTPPPAAVGAQGGGCKCQPFDELGIHDSRCPVLDAPAAGRGVDVEADEDAFVIEKLSRLLAEIAVIVKGPEPANGVWSYHDLPELVRQQIALTRQPVAGENDNG